MRKLHFVILFLSASFLSRAQHISDTLTLYIDHRVEMTVVLHDFDQLRDSNGVAIALAAFQSHVSGIANQLQPEQPELITYVPGQTLTVAPGVAQHVFLLEKEGLRNTGIRDKARLQVSNSVYVDIETKDISKIQDLSLVDCYTKMVDQLPEQTNSSQSIFYQCVNGGVTEIKEKNKTNSPGDLIELGFGGGINLIKNQWVGDFTIQMELVFNKKGRASFGPYASANLLYDFSGNGAMHINTFLNLGCRWNMADADEQARMFGLEAGYLISRQGNFFDENTSRIGFNFSPTRWVSVSPQMYITDGFKQVYPGIRLGFGL